MRTKEQIKQTRAKYYRKNRTKLNTQKKIWTQNLRQIAILLLGEKCDECGTKEKLQLHHKYYAEDSVRPTQHECGADTIKRTQEAITHPERFTLWCLPCHNKKQPRKKVGVKNFENSKRMVEEK